MQLAAAPLHTAHRTTCLVTRRIYRGDWARGVMHGCGSRIWRRPDGSMAAREGKFFGDDFVGDVMPCGSDDALDSAVEADMAAFQARSFQVCLCVCWGGGGCHAQSAP